MPSVTLSAVPPQASTNGVVNGSYTPGGISSANTSPSGTWRQIQAGAPSNLINVMDVGNSTNNANGQVYFAFCDPPDKGGSNADLGQYYFWFDLSSIPTGQTVSSAALSLWLYSSNALGSDLELWPANFPTPYMSATPANDWVDPTSRQVSNRYGTIPVATLQNTNGAAGRITFTNDGSNLATAIANAAGGLLKVATTSSFNRTSTVFPNGNNSARGTGAYLNSAPASQAPMLSFAYAPSGGGGGGGGTTAKSGWGVLL